MILFENREIATIIAALRYYQEHLDGNYIGLPNEWLSDITTDGGSEVELDTEEIERLIENKLQEFRRM